MLSRIAFVVVSLTLLFSRPVWGQACSQCDSFFAQCTETARGVHRSCLRVGCADEAEQIVKACGSFLSPRCFAALAELRRCRAKCNTAYFAKLIRCSDEHDACINGPECQSPHTPTRTATPTPGDPLNTATPIQTPTNTPPRI